MKKLNKKEQIEFDRHLQTLLDETNADYLEVSNKLEILVTINHSLNNLNEHECCYPMTSRQEKRRENLENLALEVIESLGLKGDTQRDPRGHAILIFLPSKKSNSWDGESYRIGIY